MTPPLSRHGCRSRHLASAGASPPAPDRQPPPRRAIVRFRNVASRCRKRIANLSILISLPHRAVRADPVSGEPRPDPRPSSLCSGRQRPSCRQESGAGTTLRRANAAGQRARYREQAQGAVLWGSGCRRATAREVKLPNQICHFRSWRPTKRRHESSRPGVQLDFP